MQHVGGWKKSYNSGGSGFSLDTDPRREGLQNGLQNALPISDEERASLRMDIIMATMVNIEPAVLDGVTKSHTNANL